MNELLGWYGLDKFDNRQTNGLNLTNYNCGSNKNNGAKKYKVNCPKWMGKESDADKPLSRSSSPFLSTSNATNYQSNHLNEESNGLSGTSSVPGCSNSIGIFNGEEDEDSNGHILCAWCQKIGPKVFSLRTTNGFKAFCSELCFAQCRRASFKKNKVCDWCKHVRHTVNYVDFQNGEQSLQFCSDKCLNQYKMNIFCRETQAHLNAFSAVYRSPSPPKSYSNPINIFRSSIDLSESDKDNSKETENPSVATDLWLRNSNFHQMTTSTSSQSSSLSSSPHQPSSPSPTLESLYLPASSYSQQSTFQHQPIEKCSKGETNDIKHKLSTDQFQSKDSSRQTETLTKKPLAKFKIVGNSREKNQKSKSGSILKTVSGNSNKQRSSKIQRNLSNNQENILDLNTNKRSNVDTLTCTSTTSSNHSAPFSTRFSHNPSINQPIEDKNLEPAVNLPTFINLPNPPVRMPHFPHPPHHQFFHPLRTDFLRLRQSLPMFPFNQQNLFRLPGHHRPSFPPIPVHHSPFSRSHLPPDHQSSQSPVPLQFQPSSMMGQSIPNNSFNYPGSSIPVAHPFLLPLPMPIPLPIPFPIRFSSSSNLKSLISTEDKEVQVGISHEQFSHFSCSSIQNNDTINNVNPRKTIINNSERENQTRFRIDTLMNKLIDKRMRAMSEPNDQELVNINSDCNAINLKRTKIEQSTESGINSGVDSKISSDYHDDSRSSSFLKAKRFKRDILSI